MIWASSTPPNDPSVAQGAEPGVERQVPHQRRVQRARLGQARPEPHERDPREVRRRASRSRASPRWATSPAGSPPTRCSASRATSPRRASTRRSRASRTSRSDLWCKPWYFDSTVGKNVSNNTDITVAPKDGKMVQTEDCFEIAELPDQPARPDPGQGEGARPERRLSPITSTTRSREPGASMPSFDELKPFLVLGLALGGVFAMSGVGLVVLYRATGVLNLAYGAIGAAGALISWSLIDDGLGPQWLAYLACIAFGGVVTLVYGVFFGPPFAPRDPLVKATATLGLLLILRRHACSGVYGHERARDHAADAKWNYHARRRPGELDADHRHRLPDRRHRRDRRLPAGHQGRHRDAGARPTTARSRDARRAGAPGRGGGVVRLGHRLRHRRAAAVATSSASTSSRLTFLVIPALAAALIGQLTLAVGHADRRLRDRHRAVVPHRARTRPGRLGRTAR